MSMRPIDLTGGKSVYCFNEHQLKGAADLYNSNTPSGEISRKYVAELEANCSRNEQAAIAFMLIEHLNQTSEF